MLNLSAQPAAATNTSYFFDASMVDFQQKVLMASMQQPVLAYFTASWCGPCKQLRPLLEKIVTAYAGKVTLARIDIDQSPELAQAMHIQSVPQVFAFVAGQPVDGFMGVVPESQIKQFIDGVLKMTGGTDDAASDEEASVENLADPFVRARFAFEDANPVAAAAEYREVLKTDANNSRAQTGVKFVENLMPFAAPNKAILNGDDAAAHYNHAMGLIATGQVAEGIAALLTSIKKDRKANDEIGRQQLLVLFDLLGADDARVADARRKLSALLFS